MVEEIITDEEIQELLQESEKVKTGETPAEDELLKEIDALVESVQEELDKGEKLEEKSVIKLDEKAQLKKKISITAVNIAKHEGDPLATKFEKISELKEALQGKILKKYKAKAIKKIKEAK